MWNFQDKVIVISGATRGIGHDIAISFAKEKALVVGLGTNTELLSKLESELREFNTKSMALKCDVSNENDIRNTIEKITACSNQINVLVNNAGITKDNILLRMTEEEWDKVIDINLKGAFLLTKHCSKYMIKQKAGRIVNVASVTAILGNKGQSNYSASKAGIIAFAKSVAKELSSRNITINTVLPGFVETEMTSKLPKEDIITRIPLGRFAKASDITGCVMFLSSDYAAYITGSTIIVDGGLCINI
ncbi:MAG: 3-oxoacyl-ACP reductase FabG [Planctomycetes bacterium]|nr:3-oxoacyl-ACP reductase FabG [Planctomycetota bacterium]